MTPPTRCEWCGEVWAMPASGRCPRCGHRADQDDAGNGIGHGSYGLLLMGTADRTFGATGLEGKWLAEYDPTRPGSAPASGLPLLAHIVTTDDPGKALRFSDVAAARRLWMRWDGKTRIDGRPSRPLTAFTIEVSRIPG